MKRLLLMRALLAFLAGFMAFSTATAQTATDANEGSRLTHGSALGSYDLSWWGQPGRTYFIQHSDDLLAWEYFRVIESGTADVLSWSFTSTSGKFFLRLRSSDIPTSDPFTADFDGDKVSNYDELRNGTDPLVSLDTDYDGLPDDWERRHFGDLNYYGANDDPDGDGLLNVEEFSHGTNPHSWDSDYDGLTDGEEVHIYHTDPLLWDTDGDGLSDSDEISLYHSNPLVPDATLDLDNDGLTNLEELQHDTDPQDPDTDGDGLSDGDEVHVHLTDPLNFDSDFDGLPDGWEVQYGLNPLVANDPNADPDGDGLTNAQETTYGTNPNAADTDGDGTNDGPEAAQGSNPKSAADAGQPPPPDTLVTLKLWLGAEQTAADEPGSYHEDDFQAYRMKIYEKNANGTDQTTPFIDYASNGTFVKGPTEFKFKKTKSYTVKIYTATNTPAGQPNKDFDYTALIKGCVVTDDPNGILGNHEQDQQQGKPFPQRGKKATLTIPKIEFKPLNPSSGFDDTTNPHWMMAPENGSNYAKAEITPASVANKINFVIRPDSSQEIVTPATATASPQTVTVNGIKLGQDSWVEARCEGQTEACARFNIVVKEYKLYTIDYHVITEQNDDARANGIKDGEGLPNQVCINAGANGTLDTSNVGGDDHLGGGIIDTGENGICESTKGGDDVQVIPFGQGKPDTVCISKGANNFLDSVRGGDDQIVNGNITTGTNGINESTLKNTNLTPHAAPTAADIESKLNEIIGLQTNTYFTVLGDDYTMNYDLNRSSKLDGADSQGTLSDEEDYVVQRAKNTSYDFNIFRVNDLLVAGHTYVGYADSTLSHAFLRDYANLGYATGHEVGHLFKLKHANEQDIGFVSDPDIGTRLMRSDGGGTTASRLIKYEWDIVSPAPQP